MNRIHVRVFSIHTVLILLKLTWSASIILGQGVNPGQISIGPTRSAAIKADGTVWTWGNFWTNPIGSQPIKKDGITDAKAIAAGTNHTLVLLNNGTVIAWGSNGNGQLGNNSQIDSETPVLVNQLNSIIAIAAGENFSMALKSNGTLWIWGRNTLAPLQYDTSTCVAISAYGNQGYAVMSDGGVWDVINGLYEPIGGWHYTDPEHIDPPTLIFDGVIDVAAGSEHVIFLKSDGTVWGVGNNEHGQLGMTGTLEWETEPRQVPGLQGVVAIGAGDKHSLAVNSSGHVFGWGAGHYSDISYGYFYYGDFAETFLQRSPVRVTGLTGIVAVGGGPGHSIAVQSDGTIWSWGDSPMPQIGKNSHVPINLFGINDVVDISGGDFGDGAASDFPSVTSVLDKQGSVWSWGNNNYSQYGYSGLTASAIPLMTQAGTNFRSISSGAYDGIGISHDGLVTIWGSRNGTYYLDGGVNQIKADGYDTFLVLRENGTVALWDGSGSPIDVNGLTAIQDIAVTRNSSEGLYLALQDDGKVWRWTSNWSGVFTTPQPLQGVPDAIAIAAGGVGRGLLVGKDGSVWKISSTGAPIQFNEVSGVVDVSMGYNHSLALKYDGTVWAWNDESGYYGNVYGQLGNNSAIASLTPVQVHNLIGITKIFANGTRNLVLKEDGTLAAWGNSLHGQLGAGLISTPRVDPSPILDFNLLTECPQVSITTPSNLATIIQGQSQEIEVTFSSSVGTPAYVQLYHHGVLLGTDDQPPFIFNFEPDTWGDFEITAIGVDSNGAYSARSEPVTISVPYDSEGVNGDGLPDWWEIRHFGNLAQTTNTDFDNDGLDNGWEFALLSNPTQNDSDGDGSPDNEDARPGDPSAGELNVIITFPTSGTIVP